MEIKAEPADKERFATARRSFAGVKAHGLAARLGPPVAAFIASKALISVAVAAAGFRPLVAKTWSRWDSAHYLSVAEKGYEFFSCSRLPGYDPHDFCGNAAWLPGYPLLIRLVSALGPPPQQSGALISTIFALGILVLIWNWFLGPELNTRGLLALSLAAFFPGYVYYHAVFPVSMCVVLQLCAVHAYLQRRYLLVGLSGGAAAFTYSSGFFLAAVIGLSLLFREPRQPLPTLIRQLVAAPVLILGGFAAALGVQRIQLGTWNAYYLVQAKYHYELVWPPLWSKFITALTEPGVGALARESGLVIGLVFVLIVASGLELRRETVPERANARDQWITLTLFGLVYLCVPMALGANYLGVCRSHAMLLPIVALGRRTPPVLSALLLGLAIPLAWFIAQDFVRSVLE